jgi:DNA adenine methylase
LQRLAFGGKIAQRNYGVDPHSPARFDIAKLAPMLEAIHERMAGVAIERLPWAEFCRGMTGRARCSTSIRPTTAARTTMAPGCSSGRITAMAEQLRGLKALPAQPQRPTEVGDFSGFAMEAVATTYTVGEATRPAGWANW